MGLRLRIFTQRSTSVASSSSPSAFYFSLPSTIYQTSRQPDNHPRSAVHSPVLGFNCEWRVTNSSSSLCISTESTEAPIIKTPGIILNISDSDHDTRMPSVTPRYVICIRMCWKPRLPLRTPHHRHSGQSAFRHLGMKTHRCFMCALCGGNMGPTNPTTARKNCGCAHLTLK